MNKTFIALSLLIAVVFSQNATNSTATNSTATRPPPPKKGEKFKKGGKDYEYREKKPGFNETTTLADNKEKPYFANDTFSRNCYMEETYTDNSGATKKVNVLYSVYIDTDGKKYKKKVRKSTKDWKPKGKTTAEGSKQTLPPNGTETKPPVLSAITQLRNLNTAPVEQECEACALADGSTKEGFLEEVLVALPATKLYAMLASCALILAVFNF